MDFFQQIAALDIKGDNTIRSTSPGVMVKTTATDAATTAIPPLMITGGAVQLDEGFFKRITQPLQKTGKLLANIEAYEKGQAEARSKLAAANAEKAEAKKGLDVKMVKVEAAAVAAAIPATTDDPPGEVLPRAVIYKQRDNGEELRLEYWHKFSIQVRSLLRQGVIWRIYLNENATPITELYGGRWSYDTRLSVNPDFPT